LAPVCLRTRKVNPNPERGAHRVGTPNEMIGHARRVATVVEHTAQDGVAFGALRVFLGRSVQGTVQKEPFSSGT
jgi:hypothetical protein